MSTSLLPFTVPPGIRYDGPFTATVHGFTDICILSPAFRASFAVEDRPQVPISEAAIAGAAAHQRLAFAKAEQQPKPGSIAEADLHLRRALELAQECAAAAIRVRGDTPNTAALRQNLAMARTHIAQAQLLAPGSSAPR